MHSCLYSSRERILIFCTQIPLALQRNRPYLPQNNCFAHQPFRKKTREAIPEPPPLYTSERGSGSDLSALVDSAASIRTGGATPVPKALELEDENFQPDKVSTSTAFGKSLYARYVLSKTDLNRFCTRYHQLLLL